MIQVMIQCKVKMEKGQLEGTSLDEPPLVFVGSATFSGQTLKDKAGPQMTSLRRWGSVNLEGSVEIQNKLM